MRFAPPQQCIYKPAGMNYGGVDYSHDTSPTSGPVLYAIEIALVSGHPSRKAAHQSLQLIKVAYRIGWATIAQQDKCLCNPVNLPLEFGSCGDDPVREIPRSFAGLTSYAETSYALAEPLIGAQHRI